MIREFLRSVLGKNREQYSAVAKIATDAYARHEQALAHFNKAMEIHNLVEARKLTQRREARMLEHGMRSMKGRTF